MEEQAKWDDGSVDFGIKPVTEYTFEEMRQAFGVMAQKVEQMALKQEMFEQVAQQVYGTLKARVDKLEGGDNDDLELMTVLELTTWAKEISKKVAELILLGDLRDSAATKGIAGLRHDVDNHAQLIERLRSPTGEDIATLTEEILAFPLADLSSSIAPSGLFAKMLSIESQVMAQAEDIEEARADGE